MELKNKVESVLFSAGKKVHIDELARLCHGNKEDVEKAVKELKDEYDTKNASLMVVQEGDFWKLTVREKYLNLVRKIVTATELSKTIMETLAVVAWKAPVKQSEVIKMRTNKAYDHLKELEEAEYITREKQGRTKLIKLSKKFFEYFDIPEDQLKDKFRNVTEMAKAIEEKESEIESIKKEQKKNAKAEGEQEVDLVDKKGHKVKLNEYELSEEQKQKALGEQEPHIEQEKEFLGDLEVVDEPAELEIIDEEPKEGEEPAEEGEAEEEQPEEEIKIEKGEHKKGKPEPKVIIKPEEPEEEIVLEIPQEALEEEKPKKPKKEEESPEIEEALKEIEEEREAEQEPEEESKSSAEEESGIEQRAEKRAEEILSEKDEKMSPEVEAELDKMLHPKEEEMRKETPKRKPRQREEAQEEPEEAQEEENEPEEKPKEKKKKKPIEKPDFEGEVEDLVETAGEEKVPLPESVEEPEEEKEKKKEEE